MCTFQSSTPGRTDSVVLKWEPGIFHFQLPIGESNADGPWTTLWEYLVWWPPGRSYSNSPSNSLWLYKNVNEMLADYLGKSYIYWPLSIPCGLISISIPCVYFVTQQAQPWWGWGWTGCGWQPCPPKTEHVTPAQPSPWAPTTFKDRGLFRMLHPFWIQSEFPEQQTLAFSRSSAKTIHFKGK